jgi:CopG family nickel-responsive transcriptional regulator
MAQDERMNEHDTSVAPVDDDELVRFGVSMPAALVRDLDRWRKGLGYPSRSEAVRDLVRDALVQSQWKDEGEDPTREAVGVVMLVYDHTTHQLSERLTEMQHHGKAKALAALHIHLTLENCLEVVVLRGTRTDVRELAGHLISARGVLHGVFIPTTTGEELA